jgi:hypothetical protein
MLGHFALAAEQLAAAVGGGEWIPLLAPCASEPVSMDRQTIDQTASGVKLHRVLWLIKLLRAMVLHVLLALVAALAFFLAESTALIHLPPI